MAAMTDVAGANQEGGSSSENFNPTSADYYEDSYSHFGIHEEMIKDDVRTQSYMRAIECNKHMFKDKVVMDVGCGTAILSMFAARAGARKVVGIECSQIIHQARKIVEANGYKDVITLVHSKCEDVKELPDGIEKVDIIISEWMGYFLLYESMLPTVLYARDRWLAPGGLILPDKATLYVAALEDEAYKREKIHFWDRVYGFDMSVIKEIAITEPLVDTVEGKAIVTNAAPILSLDLLTCSPADLDFSSEFRITASRDDYVHGLVAHFDCGFTQLFKPIHFSTGPGAEYTHWKQTVFYFKQDLVVCSGELLEGRISVKPNACNARDLDITLGLKHAGKHGKAEFVQDYRLR